MMVLPSLLKSRRDCLCFSRPRLARGLAGSLLAGLLLALAGPALAMRVATGTYTGTLLFSRTISGVGFQPAVVIVKGNANQPAVIKTATMGGTYSKFFESSSDSDNGIRSLDANGFVIGTSGAVNALVTSYTFLAIDESPGQVAVGSYVGDGSTARTISGLGFSPVYVMVLSQQGNNGVQRFATQPVNESLMIGAPASNVPRITNTGPDGFDVSGDAEVNKPGVTYHYVAIGASAASVATGSYTGDGSTNRIMGGLPFRPEYALVRGAVLSDQTVHRTSANGDDTAMKFDGELHLSGAIRRFRADGFELGSKVQVNAPGHKYFWLALNDAVTVADASVEMKADRTTASFGDPITLRVFATNTSLESITGLKVTSALPAGLNYTGHTASRGAYTQVGGLWSVGALAAGESAVLDITATVAVVGPATLSTSAAVLALDQSDSDPSNNNDALAITVVVEEFRMATGSYAGNGASSRPITGLGFAPSVVLVTGENAEGSVMRTSTMAAGLVKELFDNKALLSGQILSHDADGFTLGNGPTTNANGAIYHWTAFEAAPGSMTIGAYTGDGQDDRSIAGLGFRPGYLIVMSSQGQDAIHRFAPMGGDASATFKADDLKSDRIQAMEADGFQVGHDNAVNESGTAYHYIAWKDGATQAKSGLYVGDGVAGRAIDDPGFRPLHTIIRRQSSGDATVQRSASIAGDKTLSFMNVAPIVGGITALTPTGFDLGTHSSVNEEGRLYFWSAFRDSREADVGIALYQNNATPNVGDTLSLAVTVTNYGASDASNVEVSAPVPTGMVYVSATPGTGTFDPVNGKWTIGALKNGNTVTLSVSARVSEGTGATTLVHVASIAAMGELDPNNTNDTASSDIHVQAAELAIHAYVDTAFASVGDTLQFTVGVANNGPDAATSVTVAVTLPAFLSYVSHKGDGSWIPGTGVWTLGAVPGLGAATLTILGVVSAGAEGQQLALLATLSTSDQEDPVAGNNDASALVQVMTPVTLMDVAATVYPATALAGQPALAIRIEVNNDAGVGVTLATTSTISFTDGALTFTSALTNPTYVPANASNFVLAFSAAPVPAGMAEGPHDLLLSMQGTTDESWAYADTFLTTGRNSIGVTDGQAMVVAAAIVGNEVAHPGDRGIDLLRLEFQSSYPAVRSLDSLVVTNTSTGVGNTAELDGLASAVRLYGDMDGGGTLSAADSLLGSTVFTGGRATFAVAGAWTIAPSSVARLVVAVDVDSTRARDGDRMNAVIAFEDDIVFLETTSIAGTISPLEPVDSYGATTIDGMVAMQVAFADAGVDTLASGDAGVWIATLVLPTNGYATDVLNRMEIADFSGNFNSSDLAALDLVRDDGDGVYGPGVDPPLGRFAFSGDRYQLSGLSSPIAAGNRFFLVASAAGAPANGDTFRPGIPVGGVQFASDNDGPIDVDVVSPREIVFRRNEEIAVTARALAPLTVTPGRALATMLWVDVRNNTSVDATLSAIVLTNASTGAGSSAELDGNFDDVVLYADNGDGTVGPGDTILAGGLRFTAGSVTLPSLNVALPTGAAVTLLVACDVDSSCAADGDQLAVSLALASHVTTSSAVPVTGTFPITTAPARVINGMLAHQVALAILPDTLLVAGSFNNPVLDVRVHGNGYTADVLQSLTVENIGTATDVHFSRLALFVDGGDGSFDAGSFDDVELGNLAPIGGNRFRITGLSVALPGTCGQDARFYVSADIVAAPTTGASLQLAIPTLGLGVASGNDGPIDVAVTNLTVHFIPRPDELTVFPYSVGDKRVRPHAVNVLNCGVGLYNGFESPLVLGGVQLFQKGTATAAEVVRVRAWADQDTNGLFDPARDVVLATTTSAGVFYPVSGLDLTLPPKKISYVYVTYDLSLTVRDSVSVNLQINSETDITLSNPSVLRGEFPLDSPGEDVTDGMVAAQLAMTNAPSRTVPPGESDVFVLGFNVPRNGMLPDVLERVTVANAGTAASGQDLLFLNLWAEANGDGSFAAGGDRLLASLTWGGSAWRNASLLGESIPAGGLRCYVSAHISATAVDGRTVRAFLPVGGLSVASGNDGPNDTGVLNAGIQIVSTDPLIASVSTDRSSYSVGQPISITMSVRNVGGATLSGVHTDTLWASGTGGASPVGGPVPSSVDLEPGEQAEITWTYTASSTGAVTFCGIASDGTINSVVACADPLRIQSRPTTLAAEFEDRAPPALNRGQRAVNVMAFGLDHTGADSLTAAVLTGAIALRIVDNSGSPIVPNSVLSGLTLVSSNGSNEFFTLVDSTTSPLRLTLSQPIQIDAGERVDIDVFVDISASALLAPFRLGVATSGDLGATDVNDGVPVAVMSGTPFPWLTNTIAVDDPATLVRVSDDAVTAATANVGQDRVVVWDGTLENASPATAASAAVTSVVIDFHDGAGNAIAPSAAVSRLAIHGGGTTLFETSALSGASTVEFDFPSALLLPPQLPRSFVMEVDILDAPGTPGFGVTLRAPATLVARDNNSGTAIPVAPAAGASFPLVSRTIAFQQPATGVQAALVSLAPETILPSETNVEIARLRLTHASATASAIVVDSLALVFRAPDGAPFYPGNYFNRILVVGSADTLALLTGLSSVSSLVPCRFSSPVVLAPLNADSLTIVVDAKSSYLPGAFVAQIDREFIHAVDANDPGRAVAVAGVFPMQSNLSHMRLPGEDVYVSIRSSMPANAAGGAFALQAMDVILENRSAQGYTAALVESLTVAVQGRGGSALAAGAVVSVARLMEADSLVCNGAVTSSGLVFTLPADFVLSPGARRELSLVADLAPTIRTDVFRFALADATAVVASDVATDAPVACASDSPFPLATRYATVLAADEAGGFTNYPNPFAAGRESTRVTFFLAGPATVRIRMFTLWGDPVATLADGTHRAAGLHQDIVWDGRNGDGDTVNNGVYYMTLDITSDSGGSRTLRRKVAVLR